MAGKMLFPKQIQRQFKDSLVADEVFNNSSDRMDYLTNPTRYAGQIVTQKDTSEVFVINATEDGYVKLGTASDLSFKIVANYGALPKAGSPEELKMDMLFYCKEEYIDTGVDPNKTYKKGFWLFDLNTKTYISVGGNEETFTDNTKIFKPVGGLTADYNAFGKTPFEVLHEMIYPTTAPIVELSLDKDALYEVGTTVGSVTITAKVTKMSYPIDEIDIDVDGVQVKNNTDVDSIKDGYTETHAFTPSDDHTDVTIKATAKAGTTNKEETTYIKFARAGFYGTDSVNSTTYTTSDEVRALSGKSVGIKSKDKFNINIPVGAKMVVIAIPNTLSVKTIKYVEAFNTEVLDVFTEGTISVEGNNGYTADTYKLYTYIPDLAFTQAVTYSVELA